MGLAGQLAGSRETEALYRTRRESLAALPHARHPHLARGRDAIEHLAHLALRAAGLLAVGAVHLHASRGTFLEPDALLTRGAASRLTRRQAEWLGDGIGAEGTFRAVLRRIQPAGRDGHTSPHDPRIATRARRPRQPGWEAPRTARPPRESPAGRRGASTSHPHSRPRHGRRACLRNANPTCTGCRHRRSASSEGPADSARGPRIRSCSCRHGHRSPGSCAPRHRASG